MRTIALLAVLLACGGVGARFVIEEGGLKVVLPPEAKSQYPKGFDVALANFGAPRYGGTLRGRLVYVDPDYYSDKHTCSPPCVFACQDFGAATPPLDLRGDSQETYIMLVWNAQSAGARGAIVVNFEDKLTTMEAPDDDDEASVKFLTNITIPATFVTKSTGGALKALLQGGAAVYVSMDWTDILPKKQQVFWEFWTNSNDQCGPICDVQKQFIKQFVPVAKEFDSHNWTVFTPHYIVWICPPLYRTSDECRSQCIRKGRYCSPDPDGNLTAGYSGSDVVQENLRQLCVFKLSSEAGRAYLWWDYVTLFGEQCDMESGQYGEECALKVFDQVNKDGWSSRSALQGCIGQQDADADQPIMDAQLAAQKGDDKTGEGEVFILPTIRINSVQYRGKMATAEVLRAICAGFAAGNTPETCSKAVDDPCMQGGKGYQECSARTDGKTQASSALLLPAARQQLRSAACITGIPDECGADYGGCWHVELKVGGKPQAFSACKDNLAAYQDALAHGQPVDGVPLHTCTCPPCFTAVEKGGAVSCTPKCDLRYCDLDVGLCHAEPGSGGGGLGAGAVAVIVIAVVAILGGAGYLAYQYRIRSIMQQEVRAILAQYMHLPETDTDADLGAALGGTRLKPLDGV
ncbi:hypothetical protein CHLNCDRAFT_144184 [Chlorella variabilis]|uniref:Uncharacterized protein n=1 Tax=Chlorella variabilis TaxID=554065 RepID=E1ZC39_CHLVA|nr:hypothetical protein CHLNCDRAFT_144184 [Chlorella variabilis]EFN56746.1 hypothetical protein CHLNCDRAFT_144184 [Chlorella variabilis]|eukprot:XP_005848848.1 hypothetical protein CHLNCDRAFT_144184 [Chlorella variabilis]